MGKAALSSQFVSDLHRDIKLKVRIGNHYYTGEPIASGYYKGPQKDKYRTENKKVKNK